MEDSGDLTKHKELGSLPNVYIDYEDSMHSPILPIEQCHPEEATIRPYERTLTFLKEWTQLTMSLAYHADIYNQNTVHSLRHVPSKDRSSSPFLMGINLQSMILGTTLLAFPFCVKVAGIWSFISVAVIGLAANFSAITLGDCQYQTSISEPGKSKRVHISFVQLAKACMRGYGDAIMKALVYLSLLRIVVVLILLTDLTSDILSGFGISGFDQKLITVAWCVAVMPLLLVTKISCIAWISLAGLILHFCGLVSVLVASFTEYRTWDIASISWDFDVKKLGIAVGIIMNSYTVHVNLPMLEASLREPKNYKTALNVTFVINHLAKIGFALCAYLTYTETTNQEIIVNVVSHKPLPIILRVAVMLFAYASVPLQSFVLFELLDVTFKKRFPVLGRLPWLLLSRMLLMNFAILIAITVPHFGLIVSFVGSIRGSLITLILPCAFYLMLQTHEKRLYKVVICYVIIGLGLACGLLGLYSTIHTIVKGIHF